MATKSGGNTWNNNYADEDSDEVHGDDDDAINDDDYDYDEIMTMTTTIMMIIKLMFILLEFSDFLVSNFHRKNRIFCVSLRE